MGYQQMLAELQAHGKPARVGIIGTGKFGTMYVSQVRKVIGCHLVAICELDPARAYWALETTKWPKEQYSAKTMEEAYRTGKTTVITSRDELLESPYVDIIIDCTGNAELGVDTCLKAFAHGKSVVNVNVECDILAGAVLAEEAKKAGVVYSMAWGDQPAEIVDMVDWARTAGFEVVCAGKGTRFQPEYHQSTPDTIWGYYGITAEHAEKSHMRAQMFNSFLDGTKSAIEMAAVSNATGLLPPEGGLNFPPVGTDDLPRILKPKDKGGLLDHSGMVEVIASEERDGRPVFKDLRFGIYVTLHGDSPYMMDCYKEYGMHTDPTGEFTCLYRPYHMIGLETNITVAQIATRHEATGVADAFRSDVVAVAKFDIPKGTVLDGEGGFWVYGNAVPAKTSVEKHLLPLNFSANKKVLRDIKAGEVVSLNDVEYDPNCQVMQLRERMKKFIK